MQWAMIAQLAGQVLGIGAAAFGQWWAKADEAKRKKTLEQAQALYQNMSPPEQEALHSAAEGLPLDYGNKDARNRALQGMIDMGLQGGNDAGSVLAMEQARRAGAQAEQQGRGAVRQEFARRGLGGAGEASLQLQAQQAGADRTAMGDLQAAGDARSRALQALAQGGGMAQQAESADNAQAANRAASLDSMARFNAGLAQQGWENRLGLADRRYGGARDMAGFYESKAEKKRRLAGGIGQSFNQAGGTVGSYLGGGK